MRGSFTIKVVFVELSYVAAMSDSGSNSEENVGLEAGRMVLSTGSEVTVIKGDSVGCGSPGVRMVPVGSTISVSSSPGFLNPNTWCSTGFLFPFDWPESGSSSEENIGFGAGGMISSIGIEATAAEGDSVGCDSLAVRMVPAGSTISVSSPMGFLYLNTRCSSDFLFPFNGSDSRSTSEEIVGLGAGWMISSIGFEVIVAKRVPVGCDAPMDRVVIAGSSVTAESVSGSSPEEKFGLGAGGVIPSSGAAVTTGVERGKRNGRMKGLFVTRGKELGPFAILVEPS